MPRMTIRKIALIACIAGLGATAAATIGHARKTSILDSADPAASYQATPNMCPASVAPTTRTPAYKRYLKQTSAPRFTPRRG